MQVIVKARHMDLTDTLKTYADEKLGKGVTKFFDRPAARIEIELSEDGHHKDGTNNLCRVTVFMPQGRTIVIQEEGVDMYSAIDRAQDRLFNQVKRERERKNRNSRNRKAAAKWRDYTRRRSLTAGPELWEREVAQYEQSLA